MVNKLAKNDFKAFATGENANVLSQAEYEELAALVGGFSSGIARSEQLNKVWRQASTIASVVAAFMADKSGDDVLDDGDTAKLQSTLIKALLANARTQLDDVYLQKSQNLAELPNKSIARKNLELDKVGNYVAIQQGGGIGQNTNKIYIGWKNNGKLGATVDSTDVGELFTTQNPPTAAQTGAYPLAGGNLNGSVITNTGSAGLVKPPTAWNGASSSNMIFQASHQNGVDSVYSDFFLKSGEYWAWRIYIIGGDKAIHVLEFRNDGSLRVSGQVCAGNAFLATDGNVYGTVWGGYLSTWVNSQIGSQINANNTWVNNQIGTQIGNNNGWVINSFQPKNTGNPGAGWWRDSATGLIMQAGTVAVPVTGSTGSASFSFPLTFPNGLVSITGNTAGKASSAGYVACAAFLNANSSGATVLVDTNASRNMDQTQYVRFIAYGV